MLLRSIVAAEGSKEDMSVFEIDQVDASSMQDCRTASSVLFRLKVSHCLWHWETGLMSRVGREVAPAHPGPITLIARAIAI